VSALGQGLRAQLELERWASSFPGTAFTNTLIATTPGQPQRHRTATRAARRRHNSDRGSAVQISTRGVTM